MLLVYIGITQTASNDQIRNLHMINTLAASTATHEKVKTQHNSYSQLEEVH